MGNKKRLWVENSSYHITARGNRRNDIFKDEEDFGYYITLLKEVLEYYMNDYEIAAYCLMDNHIHILISVKNRHMRFFISRLNSIYTKYFNKKYNYIGHLFQDRYFSELIETDEQMLETSRYIHLNPVKANMVEKPEEYKMSSYNVIIGDEVNGINDMVSREIILNYFNGRKDKYKIFIEQGINQKYAQKNKNNKC